MKKLSMCPITLDGNDIEQKRAEILSYFENSFSLFEKLFEMLASDTVFYKRSEPTRHAMIFYFGHTAVFYINKLVAMQIIPNRINPHFESIFAVGVDEMEWDDIDKKTYEWPDLDSVRSYRQEVRKRVKEVIQSMEFSLPITQESGMWIILMAIEHERIHLETSSVLHRQLPITDVRSLEEFRIYKEHNTPVPKNSLIEIEASLVQLGVDREKNRYYGWDNEYGRKEVTLKPFLVSKYLVSNGEFLEFVQAGGYEKKEFWSEEGWQWREKKGVIHPPFWVSQKDGFGYRILSEIISMPLAWPVDVNAHEAEAYCRYLSKKHSKRYTLPSEAEYKAILQLLEDDPFTCNEKMANHNFMYASATPVDMHPFKLKNKMVVYDVVGNVWQWSRSAISPFEGFEAHPAYDDFSIPTFDGKHNLILGSSWASTGNLILPHSRYAFRKHFYQHAGFRYVVTSNSEQKEDIYETDALVSQYCEFQYGSSYFGVKNFAKSCVELAKKYMQHDIKALDLGCATGRASFELARLFQKVDGVDFSARFIAVATMMKNEGLLRYKIPIEGEISQNKEVRLKDLGLEKNGERIDFWQGDACNLKPYFQGYDLVLATNLIDRLYQPKLFLQKIHERINPQGILIITSPYSWQEESTRKEFWLGGYKDVNGKEYFTFDALQTILGEHFELVAQEDIPFVIRETQRKFQHTLSEATVWRKKDV